MLIKTMINIIELIVIAKFIFTIMRFTVRGRNGSKYKGKNIKTNYKRKRSIIGKILLLISRNLHYRLDLIIKKQKESLANTKSDQSTQDSKNFENVINLKKYKNNRKVN